MKKIIYTILSILSIVYICFLTVNIVKNQTNWDPNFGAFKPYFDLIVNFGGVAIIFCFALINFAGSPLKTVFFIILIVVIICYIIVLAAPDFIYGMFGGKAAASALHL